MKATLVVIWASMTASTVLTAITHDYYQYYSILVIIKGIIIIITTMIISGPHSDHARLPRVLPGRRRAGQGSDYGAPRDLGRVEVRLPGERAPAGRHACPQHLLLPLEPAELRFAG